MQYSGKDKDDRQLWADLKKGKEKALSELFMLHLEELYEYGYMLCRDRALVEDCIQDLFLKLWQNRRTLTEVTTVQSYLIVALRNRIHDSFRKKKKEYSLEDHKEAEQNYIEASTEDHWVKLEHQKLQREAVKEVLNKLPERMRQAVYLRYFEGLEYADIAHIMKIRRQVAINMVYRAGKKLRAYSDHYSEWIFVFMVISLF